MKALIKYVLIVGVLSSVSWGNITLTAEDLAIAQGISWYYIEVPLDAPPISNLIFEYKNQGKVIDSSVLPLLVRPGNKLKLYVLSSDEKFIRVSVVNDTLGCGSQSCISFFNNRFWSEVVKAHVQNGDILSLRDPVLFKSIGEDNPESKILLYLGLKEKVSVPNGT